MQNTGAQSGVAEATRGSNGEGAQLGGNLPVTASLFGEENGPVVMLGLMIGGRDECHPREAG